MHFGSPSDPSQTAAAEAKPRYVYSILKPHGQSFRRQVRLLLSQSRSQAVVCVSTPRMYPRSGYFLVFTYNIVCFIVILLLSLNMLRNLFGN